ncbi:MAG: hypothetical protein NT154_43290 [Verrucomicrobia bacterium]|nr:hypothetical protein [Verrucomicrobiota bacterium]
MNVRIPVLTVSLLNFCTLPLLTTLLLAPLSALRGSEPPIKLWERVKLEICPKRG